VTELASAESAAGPSAAGSVVLDIGAGTGALVLFAPAQLDGAEIEISAAGESDGRRTHSRVRKRGCGGSAGSGGLPHASPGAGPGGDSASYAAVYPGLAAGTYTIWRDAQTPAGTVVIGGGQVTTWHWPSAAAAGKGGR
jgi:hypothetical protein